MRKFNIGDCVVVTNLDGETEIDEFMYPDLKNGIGARGIVIDYMDNASWSVTVEHEDGTVYYYSESELEVAE